MEEVRKVRDLLRRRDLDVAVIETRENFAWLTGGGFSAVAERSGVGVGTLVISEDEVVLIADNIEIERLRSEEIGDLTVRPHAYDWWTSAEPALEELLAGRRAGSDSGLAGTTDISSELVNVRSVLDPVNLDRYRAFGPLASASVERALRSIEPGWTEKDIQGAVIREALAEGIRPAVVLVGVDHRLSAHRHPVVTDTRLEKYAMVVLCGEKHGLIANTTRFVHFGSMPEELHARHRACAEILSSTVARTTAGTPYAELWQHIVKAYEVAGFPDEWRNHHQGGPTGYGPREWLLTPERPGQVENDMVFAWNPSVPGAKAEDTVIVSGGEPEVITLTDSWPSLEVTVDGQTYTRAGVLER